MEIQKILIVEDFPKMREILVRTLKWLGYEDVHEVGSVEEALNTYSRVRPDLVFMDICLPGKDGLQGLTELRALDKNVQVVMLSAESTLENVQQALKLGAKGFVCKPFNNGRIKEVITKCNDAAATGNGKGGGGNKK